jgi:hypothetical protein
MPYELFTKTEGGKIKYCHRNKNTGKVVCYDSEKKRKAGMRIREAVAHGWKPSRVST